MKIIIEGKWIIELTPDEVPVSLVQEIMKTHGLATQIDEKVKDYGSSKNTRSVQTGNTGV